MTRAERHAQAQARVAAKIAAHHLRLAIGKLGPQANEADAARILAGATRGEMIPEDVQGPDAVDALAALAHMEAWQDASQDWITLAQTPLGKRWGRVYRLALDEMEAPT